jgi:hypothetical protein
VLDIFKLEQLLLRKISFASPEAYEIFTSDGAVKLGTASVQYGIFKVVCFTETIYETSIRGQGAFMSYYEFDHNMRKAVKLIKERYSFLL